MENYLLRDKRRTKKQKLHMSIKDWLNDLSPDLGTLSDDTEVRSVEFEDGLLAITLGKIVPEYHKRKDYL
jgi:hypothetical protein